MSMDTQVDTPFTDVIVDAPFIFDVAPGVEPGFELAPIETMTDIAPLDNDVIDGDWRVIDSPVTDIEKPFTFDDPWPVAQPLTQTSLQPWAQPATDDAPGPDLYTDTGPPVICVSLAIVSNAIV
jgi:hypothetical protein